ncbi:MAG: pilus assembly protein [Oceanospirillaceae bacterium]|nr:pilus assembly protein [Oceanospirillaceae bacterium]
MVEMIVISFTALLLLFGIIQFALLYNAKTVLNYATFEAARIGALNYAHPDAMRLALAQKLAVLEPVTPLEKLSFVPTMVWDKTKDYQQLVAQQEGFLEEFDSIACIKRVSPTDNSGHWQSAIKAPGGVDSIPNDHLLHRDRDLDSEGLSIQDANLLKISVSYCPKMIVPIVSSVVKNLMLLDRYNELPVSGSFMENQLEGYLPPDSLTEFQTSCYENNRFPMVAQALIRMQTPVGKYSFSDCGS